ncbi:MAG: T9SS type A sorting domain-containing protein [Bacteroidota bacterium]
MKRFAYILLFFCLLFFRSEAQLTLPFPDSTGAWTWSCSGKNCNSSSRYYVAGDTIINSVQYHILRMGSTNLNDSSDWMSGTNIIGYFREDSSKIYFLDDSVITSGGPFCFYNYNSEIFSTNNEILLYDFTLASGETFNLTPSLQVIVTNIDSVLLNGNYYRRWNFDGYFIWTGNGSYSWIEGIGSNIGFFPYYYFFEDGVVLNCFHENNEDIILYLGNASDCASVGIDENKTSIENTILSPNPNNGKFKLDITSSFFPSKTIITITDITGRLIYQFSPSEAFPSISIDIPDRSGGLYFAIIDDGRKKEVVKFIKE